ncbi:MAG: hypothetical protein QOG54_1502 [Actinomycetota bacterium]|nr:hypothetical protein [Actinomycetota bacterium]
MAVEIRRVEVADWEVVRDVRLAALADSPDAFWATHEDEVTKDESWWRDFFGPTAWFIAEIDGRPTGIAAGLRARELGDEERALISMWVDPSARGKGVGRRLIAAVCDWSRVDGASSVVLEVAEGNDGAAALYRSCGFEATGNTQPLPRKPSIIEHEMRLQLSPEGRG